MPKDHSWPCRRWELWFSGKFYFEFGIMRCVPCSRTKNTYPSLVLLQNYQHLWKFLYCWSRSSILATSDRFTSSICCQGIFDGRPCLVCYSLWSGYLHWSRWPCSPNWHQCFWCKRWIGLAWCCCTFDGTCWSFCQSDLGVHGRHKCLLCWTDCCLFPSYLWRIPYLHSSWSKYHEEGEKESVSE